MLGWEIVDGGLELLSGWPHGSVLQTPLIALLPQVSCARCCPSSIALEHMSDSASGHLAAWK